MHVVDIEPTNLFQALSDLTRIRMLRLLISTKQDACLCDFTESLNEAQYNLSRHLKVLRQVGLVSAEKEGRWIYHGLVKDKAHLHKLYELVAMLPDSNGTFKEDLKQMTKILRARANDRCRREERPPADSPSQPRIRKKS